MVQRGTGLKKQIGKLMIGGDEASYQQNTSRETHTSFDTVFMCECSCPETNKHGGECLGTIEQTDSV